MSEPLSTYVCLSVCHQRASLAQLEAVAAAVGSAAVRTAAFDAGCSEVLALRTCSRAELHVMFRPDRPDRPVGPDGPDEAAVRAQAVRLARRLLEAVATVSAQAETVRALATTRVGAEAVAHVFRVAAGVESRVPGEVEIQGQLRRAARHATAVDGEPHRLRRLVGAALAAARGASGDDASGRNGLLVRRAVDCLLARTGPRPAQVVVVGAGTIGRQVVDVLTEHGCGTTVVSRRPAHGDSRDVHPVAELPTHLAGADAVVLATSAAERVLSADLVREVLRVRAGRPFVVADLALPRNVDPAVAALPGVHLIDLDDLRTSLPDLVPVAEAVAEAEAAAATYVAQMRSRRAGPLIAALRRHTEQVCLAQMRRTARRTPLPDDVLATMASAVAGALTHAPTTLLREAAADDDTDLLDRLGAAYGLPAAG